MDINNDWQPILQEEFKKDYFIEMSKILKKEYTTKIIFPPKKDVFNCFKLTPYKDTKVVILGQDPYINENQAMGLAFSVPKTERIPPSLKNIYKELHDDIGCDITHGDLTSWAKQGVLLLNTTLTVVEKQSNSHSKIGWNIFTDNIISKLNERDVPIIFLLWGGNAISKKSLITNKIHLVLTGTHPSPLSANKGGFFGGKYFSKTNTFLKDNKLKEIDWEII